MTGLGALASFRRPFPFGHLLGLAPAGCDPARPASPVDAERAGLLCSGTVVIEAHLRFVSEAGRS